jgi:predicted nucleotidyltransferase
MDSNLRELLSALNEHSVRYVVVGGYAVGVHAQPRVTKDLDVFIDATPKNAEAVYQALIQFGAPLDDVRVSDFLIPTSILRIGVPPICVEIMQQIDGVSFEMAYQGGEEHLVDGDVPVRYISAEHLILNKRTAGRSQDLADVEAVLRAQHLKGGGSN